MESIHVSFSMIPGCRSLGQGGNGLIVKDLTIAFVAGFLSLLGSYAITR